MASYPKSKFVFTVDSFVKLKPLKETLQDQADIFFLMDDSGSITNEDFSDMQKFIIEILHTFRIGPDHVRMGLVKYSDSPSLQFDLTQHSDAKTMENVVKKIIHEGGGTNTGEALSSMKGHFENAKTSRGYKVSEYLIVITDGQSQDEVKDPAEELRRQGVIIYAIGVKSSNDNELNEIAGDPKRKFFVDSFDALKTVKNNIIREICILEDCKIEKADIIFLVDGSGSIKKEQFKSMQTFMASVVTQTTVGENLTRFGVILYSDAANSSFTLNEIYSKGKVLEALQQLIQPQGGTYTGAALAYSLQYFNAKHGGRREIRVPQILMVITDGAAQDRDRLKAESDALRKNGVTVISIGVKDADRKELETMAGDDTSKVFFVDNFEGLETLYKKISPALCTVT
uniref:VWFA domain-containing protein n=1 Tax=Oreochromis niloticus TaxID=8128 RepID=A0A669E6G3_ORENI